MTARAAQVGATREAILDATVGLFVEREPVEPGLEAIAARAQTTVQAVKPALSVFARRAPHEVADLRAALATASPDVLLVDRLTWGAAAGGPPAGADAWRGCSPPGVPARA